MADKHNRLVELSTSIVENTAVLDEYIKSNNLPQPSFEVYEPVWDVDFPPTVQKARIAIQDATTELCELTTPTGTLLRNAIANQVTDFHTIYRLSIPHKIPLDNASGISYSDLMRKFDMEVNETALIRILRSAIVHHIFKEPSPGFIAHSAASRLLVDNPISFEWLDISREVFLPRQYLGQALTRWPDLAEPNRAAASLAYSKGEGDYESFYEYLFRQPAKAQTFGKAMTLFHKGTDYFPRHLVEGVEWGAVSEGATVVDLGGSHGQVAIAVAKSYPQLKFVVQDSAATIGSVPSAVKDMIKNEELDVDFMVHDFFQEQVVKGAKIYILRWILHNWPDGYCVKILRALRPALEKDSKVVVMDAVMPSLGTLPNVLERQLRFMDLTMLACFNAGDREADQWNKIFTDAGFRLLKVAKPTGSKLTIMELEAHV